MFTTIKTFAGWIAGGVAVVLVALMGVFRRQRDVAREAEQEAKRQVAIKEAEEALRRAVDRRTEHARGVAYENEKEQQIQKRSGQRPDRFGDGRLRDD